MLIDWLTPDASVSGFSEFLVPSRSLDSLLCISSRRPSSCQPPPLYTTTRQPPSFCALVHASTEEIRLAYLHLIQTLPPSTRRRAIFLRAIPRSYLQTSHLPSRPPRRFSPLPRWHLRICSSMRRMTPGKIPSSLAPSVELRGACFLLSDTLINHLHNSPLCVEEFDLSDKNFRPCPCGYQVGISAPKPQLLAVSDLCHRSASSVSTTSRII
jgi:hypothetical protein